MGDETESEFRISQGHECPSGHKEMCPGAKGTEKGPHQPGASYLQGGWCRDLAHGGAWEGVQQGLFMMWRPGSGNGGMCGSQGDVGGCAELGRSRRDGLRGCGNTRWLLRNQGFVLRAMGRARCDVRPGARARDGLSAVEGRSWWAGFTNKAHPLLLLSRLQYGW